jgi:hypothetical protein
MLSLKTEVGKVAGPFREAVSRERIELFCQAAGACHEGVAPPTFFTVFRKGEFDLLQSLGLSLAQVLHADQEYEYEAPVLAGDFVHFQTTLTHVLEKQRADSFMQFLTFETELKAERASEIVIVGKAKSTIVVRGSKSV